MDFSIYLGELKKLYTQTEAILHLHNATSEDDIQSAESSLGYSIDPGLRAAWKLANGGHDGFTVFSRPNYLTGYYFLPLTQALDQHTYMARRASNYEGYVEPSPRDHRIRNGWFQLGWLPFANFGGASLLLIQDHSPAPDGTAGQIIAYTHDPDQISYVAPSFADFLLMSLQNIMNDPDEFIQEV